jgi:hypothetical protein
LELLKHLVVAYRPSLTRPVAKSPPSYLTRSVKGSGSGYDPLQAYLRARLWDRGNGWRPRKTTTSLDVTLTWLYAVELVSCA